MGWGQAASLAVGVAALIWMLAAVGFERIAHSVALGGPALPVAIGIHGLQLFVAGLAWFEVVGRGPATSVGLRGRDFGRLRWIREGVNTLLPAAHIGGQVVSVRMLVKHGVAPVRAVVGTILDVVLETVAQLLVMLLAVALLFWMRGGGPAGAHEWLVWVGSGIGVLGLIVAGIVVGLWSGALRWIETALQRAASRWPAMGNQWSMVGLSAMLVERQADQRAMIRALLLDMLSWSMGSTEVWVILHALGLPTGLEACFVIESLAMVARTAGFAIPGAVGIQEGGFVLACSLFGIDAETALALSVLKRLRELVIASTAVFTWQISRRGY